MRFINSIFATGLRFFGIYLFKRNRFDLAHALLSKSRSLSLDDASVNYYLGEISACNQEWSSAIAYYQSAIQASHGYFHAHLKLGEAYLKIRAYRAAENAFKCGIDIDPKSHWALMGLGKTLALEKKWEFAEQALRKAISACSTEGWIYYKLSEVLDAQGKAIESVEFYCKAVRLLENQNALPKPVPFEGFWVGPNLFYIKLKYPYSPDLSFARLIWDTGQRQSVAPVAFFPLQTGDAAGICPFLEKPAGWDDAPEGARTIYLAKADHPLRLRGSVLPVKDMQHLRRKLAEQHVDVWQICLSFSKHFHQLFTGNQRETGRRLVNALQHTFDSRPGALMASEEPFQAGIDHLIPIDWEGVFIWGWINDGRDQILDIHIECAYGFKLCLPPTELHWFEKRANPDEIDGDAEEPGFTIANNGFCGFVPIPGQIRQAHSHLPAPRHYQTTLNTQCGLQVTFAPKSLPGTDQDARDRLLASDLPGGLDEKVVNRCLLPVLQKLQRRCMDRVWSHKIDHFGSPPGQPAASLIIPLYDRFDFIPIQLAALAADKTMAHAEIIFVLDQPAQYHRVTQTLRNHLPLYGLPTTLVTLNQNSGYSNACNSGARAAKGAHLLFLNSDVIPGHGDWLQKMLDAYQRDPQIGILGPKLLYADKSLQHAGMYYDKAPSLTRAYLVYHYFKGYPQFYEAAQKSRPVPAVTGACLLIRKSLFDQVGGFSTDYIIGDFEDSDLCLACRRLGFYSVYYADIELYHLERQSVPGHAISQKDLTRIYNRLLHHQKWAADIKTLMKDFSENGNLK